MPRRPRRPPSTTSRTKRSSRGAIVFAGTKTPPKTAPALAAPRNWVNEQTTKAIDALLARELTVDGAVQIALLGSPHLRSKFEELSIGQADLVQAGLLKNPVFSIGMTAWESEHISPNLFVAVEQDFLDIVTMPMRKRIAATQLEAVKLEVGDAVLELAAEVRSAFYAAQGAAQTVAMRAMVDEAAATSAELAARQHEAGNMSDLAFSSELALASQAHLDFERSQGEAAVARERLNQADGPVGQTHPMEARAAPPRATHARASARASRVSGHREAPRYRSRATRGPGARVRVVVGQDHALDRDRQRERRGRSPAQHAPPLVRPGVALEIPLFDQRQASIARLEAFKRQGENELHALAIDVRSDVRSSLASLHSARRSSKSTATLSCRFARTS